MIDEPQKDQVEKARISLPKRISNKVASLEVNQPKKRKTQVNKDMMEQVKEARKEVVSESITGAQANKIMNLIMNQELF